MEQHIVVTGATGTIGQRVVEGLLARRARVIALTRNAAKAAPLEARGARIATGSFEDAGSLDRAFAGADTMVLITPAGAQAAEQHARALQAAQRARIRKIVRISAVKADIEGPTDDSRQHARSEAALATSGLIYVILRSHALLQNLLGSLPSILDRGELYFGGGDGRLGLIDARDVAEAAVVAATTDRHDRSTYELTGPESLDYHAVAAAIGRGIGREVVYVPIRAEAAGEAVRKAGGDAWTAGMVRDYCAAYARGWGDFRTGNVQRMTGRAPRTVDDFVRDVLAPAARAAAT